jgi:glutathione S-transferase
LRDGGRLIAQTANILLYLGRRHGLAPRDEAGRLWAHQLQLTIADLVNEAHDTHHPIASGLYYEDQREEAGRRTADFIANRIPKYLGYFERVLERNKQGNDHLGNDHLVGRRGSYCDLSLFQIAAGLRYAFPRAMARLEPRFPRVIGLHDRVASRPRVDAYLKSARRIPFNEQGIFRHYPELDAAS